MAKPTADAIVYGALRNWADRGLLIWFALLRRWAWVVIILAVIAAGLTVRYTVKNIRVNTDTADMISDQLAWRQAEKQIDRAFPQYVDNIVVVIEGHTADEVKDAGRELGQRLRGETTLLQAVYQPENDTYFRENGLLFLDQDELADVADNLAKVQPFLSKLAADQSLRGLFDLLKKALTEEEGKDLDVDFAFKRIAAALKAQREERHARLSWESLMAGKDPKLEDRRGFIVVQPRLDFSSLLPGEDAIKGIRQIAADLKLKDRYDVRVRLTGSAALGYDELESASLGAQIASVGSLLGVALVMLVGLRSVWLTLATLLALVLGLIFTAGFATLAIGELNLISIGFAVMYIGIGADYAIYLCLRYKELAQAIPNYRHALRNAVTHVGGSLGLCTITTSVGFFAFVPTEYVGVAQLGIISGAGMFISLVVTILILPAFLILRRPRRNQARAPRELPAWLVSVLNLPRQFARPVLVMAAIAAVLAAGLVTRAKFDHNPLNLQDPTVESVQTYRDLLETSERPPWSIVLLAPNAAEAEAIKQRLEKLPSVDDAMSFADFVPKDQPDKLATIQDLILTLGPELETVAPKAKATAADNFVAVQKFAEILGTQGLGVQSPARAELFNEIKYLSHKLDGADPAGREQVLAATAVTLLGLLPNRLTQLTDSLKAHAVTTADVPADTRARWVTANGQQRIEVFPKENLNDRAAMQRFVAQVRKLAPAASGPPVTYLGASRAVVGAFQQAFYWALVSIAVILLATMTHTIDVFLVMAPLLLAALLTSAATVLLGIPFNFANIIALPLLLGMGVDNGIHMVHRYRTAPPKDGVMLRTTTSMAVALSALTNISGFGNFAVSPHRGTASMGVLLTVGILLLLSCTMIVLPSLLSVLQERGWLRHAKPLTEEAGEDLDGEAPGLLQSAPNAPRNTSYGGE